MKHVEGIGYRIEWDSDGDGYARITVKAASSVAAEMAGEWLPEDQWFVCEFHGEDAFERALKSTLDGLWGPERAPHRYP